jgi:GNAT superfamily N-acetyltransferase
MSKSEHNNVENLDEVRWVETGAHPSVRIRSTTESDWRRLSEFRLENAAAHPISYGATYEQTLAFDEEAWRMRARRGDRDDAAQWVAIEEATGRWVSMMACQLGDDLGPEPVLTGVYTSEEFRGRSYGIADALLELVETWAAEHGDSLRLFVHEDSEPARRFYCRHGFIETGRSHVAEISDRDGAMSVEMAKSLNDKRLHQPSPSRRRGTERHHA